MNLYKAGDIVRLTRMAGDNSHYQDKVGLIKEVKGMYTFPNGATEMSYLIHTLDGLSLTVGQKHVRIKHCPQIFATWEEIESMIGYNPYKYNRER